MAEAVSMQNLYNANGKINWFGWIMFIATVILICYSIYQCHLNITKMGSNEENQTKKLNELEMNLREVRGNQYKNMNI